MTAAVLVQLERHNEHPRVRKEGDPLLCPASQNQPTDPCTTLAPARRHGRAGDKGRAGAPPAGAGETVLLVEDETQVRELAAERLRELGCSVLEAADGSAALRRLRANSRVDLLVTDVGLPGGLNGRQVADAARERRPGLPLLFITGYAGDILEGQPAPGMAVIGKPFTLDALAVQVWAMLEAAPTA